jgi:hypothetical protein
MDAVTQTPDQLERTDLITALYDSADPGTFQHLELLTLAELKTLWAIMFEEAAE